MSTDGPDTVALAFMEQINRRDPSGLSRLMTKDHVFVDSWGQSTRGREAMRDGWVGYYRMFPDYQVGIEDVLSEGDVVLLTGTTRGTYSVDGELRKENDGTSPRPGRRWSAAVSSPTGRYSRTTARCTRSSSGRTQPNSRVGPMTDSRRQERIRNDRRS